MPTKKQLLTEASSAGLCCFWKLRKQELEGLLNTIASKRPVPERFLGKKSIGDACLVSSNCKTRRCEEGLCVSSKYYVKVIKESSASIKANNTQAQPDVRKATVESKRNDVKNITVAEPRPKRSMRKKPNTAAKASTISTPCGSSKLCGYF